LLYFFSQNRQYFVDFGKNPNIDPRRIALGGYFFAEEEEKNVHFFSQQKKRIHFWGADLFLPLLAGEERKLVVEDLLRVEDLLVVHLLHEGGVLDAVRLQELDVSHLESLADGLGDELGLKMIINYGG
jgi:hypothetical protein